MLEFPRTMSGSVALLFPGSAMMSVSPIDTEDFAETRVLEQNLKPCWCPRSCGHSSYADLSTSANFTDALCFLAMLGFDVLILDTDYLACASTISPD